VCSRKERYHAGAMLVFKPPLPSAQYTAAAPFQAVNPLPLLDTGPHVLVKLIQAVIT
jgi:hypothetical protein